jgi:hypothetical protein
MLHFTQKLREEKKKAYLKLVVLLILGAGREFVFAFCGCPILKSLFPKVFCVSLG